MELETWITLAALVVGGISLIVTMLIHRSDVERGERQQSDQGLDSVVEEYLRLVGDPAPVDTGPKAFVRAGAKNLSSSDEILEAVHRIEARLGTPLHHPFGGRRRKGVMAYDDVLGLIRDLTHTASNWDQVCDERKIPETE